LGRTIARAGAPSAPASLIGKQITFDSNGNSLATSGTVTAVQVQSVTVETAPKVTRTLTLSDKTTFNYVHC
jgi:hypothetical protein